MYKQRIELLLKSAIDEIIFATSVPWKAIKGMRAILVHDYLSVEEPEILSILQQDLPALLPTVTIMLNDVQSGKYDDYFADLDKKKASR